MTNSSLGRAYLEKAQKRLPVLDLLHREGAYSDVVRQAQEIVELALKGALRLVGVEPPKLHDVGPVLLEHAGGRRPGPRGRPARGVGVRGVAGPRELIPVSRPAACGSRPGAGGPAR